MSSVASRKHRTCVVRRPHLLERFELDKYLATILKPLLLACGLTSNAYFQIQVELNLLGDLLVVQGSCAFLALLMVNICLSLYGSMLGLLDK